MRFAPGCVRTEAVYVRLVASFGVRFALAVVPEPVLALASGGKVPMESPPSSLGRAVMVAWWLAAMARTIERPRPCPSWW
jgi:hypothetical protein